MVVGKINFNKMKRNNLYILIGGTKYSGTHSSQSENTPLKYPIKGSADKSQGLWDNLWEMKEENT